MAIVTPQWEGIKKEMDREFNRTLKENLVFAALMPRPRFVRDLGVQVVENVKYGEDTGAWIAMETPEFQPTGMGGPTVSLDKIPLMGKDLHVDERQRLAEEFAGVDTVQAEEKAFALAKEIDDFLAFGNTKLGIKGILNHGDILTYDNSASTDWTVANDAVADLNAAVAELLDAEHYGPYALMMNPLDSDLFGSFITNTSVQLEEKLNRNIRPGIIYSKRIVQNNAYLIEFNARNFRPIVPRNVGAVGRVLTREKTDELTGALSMRKLTALGLQIRHGDGVQKITFDRT